MKIFLCCQKSFGRAVLKRLASDGHEIVGVAVPPQERYYDKAQGAAALLGVRHIVDSERLRKADIPAGTDLIVAAHAHQFIQASVRGSARLGAIGFHPSLLPRHRGRDAVRWAVRMGDAITGATVYRLDETVDGGPVALQRPVFILPGWTYHDLWAEIFPIGVEMLSEACGLAAEGLLPSTPQNDAAATWEPAFDQSRRLYRPELLALEARDA